MLSPIDDATGAARLRSASEGGRPKLQLEIAALTVRQFGAAFEDLSTPRPALNTIENIDIDLEKITLAEGASMPLRAALATPDKTALGVAIAKAQGLAATSTAIAR